MVFSHKCGLNTRYVLSTVYSLLNIEELLFPRLMTYLFCSNSSSFYLVPDKYFQVRNFPQLNIQEQTWLYLYGDIHTLSL